MNVLPRLLYLFQMLPIEISKLTFDKLHKMVSKFIWQGKQPRVRLKTLQLAKPNGGVGLPNFRYYFWAAQLRPLISWIKDSSYTRWLDIEKGLSPIPLKVLPSLDVSFKNTQMGEWTKVTLKIWKTVQTAFRLPKQISSAGSIGHLESFVPANLDAGFKKWSEYGLCFVYQLIRNRELKSFEQLRREFTLPRTDFFRYLQLRHFLTTHKEWEKVKNPSLIEEFFS